MYLHYFYIEDVREPARDSRTSLQDTQEELLSHRKHEERFSLFFFFLPSWRVYLLVLLLSLLTSDSKYINGFSDESVL